MTSSFSRLGLAHQLTEPLLSHPARGVERRDAVEPLTADLRRLHVTVDAQFLKLLDSARNGLSHAIPGASTEQVLKAALELLLEKQARALGLVKRPRTVTATSTPTSTPTPTPTPTPTATPTATTSPATPGAASATAPASNQARVAPEAPSQTPAPVSATAAASPAASASVSVPAADPTTISAPATATATAAADVAAETPPPCFTPPLYRRTDPRRHVPAAVVRAVWQRDGGRCAWPLDGGGVCGSTHRLELDHIVPWARWGDETVADLRIACHAHNTLAARQAFGARCMARYGPRAAP